MSEKRLEAEAIYVALWNVPYVILRGILRVLLGRVRRQYVQNRLGLYPPKLWSVKQACFSPGYEPQVQKVMRKKLKKGSMFLDVGGAIGVHSLYANRLVGSEGRVIVVEPDPINCEILKKSRWESSNVTLIEKAVWIMDGHAYFSLGTRYLENDDTEGIHSTTGSLTPLPEHYTKGFIQDKKTKVSTIRLDTLAEWIGVDIDLAKFDIEGSEYEVFADSKLDLSKFDNLIIEAHGRYPSDDVKMLVRNLRAKGFKITPLTKRESENIHILAEKDKSIRHK